MQPLRRADSHGSRSAPRAAVLGLSFFAMAAGAFLFQAQAPSGTTLSAALAFYVPLAGSAAALACAHAMRRLNSYYIALGLRILFFVLTIPSTTALLAVGLLLFGGLMIELACFEPYPANLFEIAGTTLAAAAIGYLTSDTSGTAARLAGELPVLLVGAFAAAFGAGMTRFRELAVDLLADRDRLTRSVVSLTRANSEYQDYAVNAQEKAAEKERRRITRDIHDIVGYTLTNNIMLMEAAQDLMQENPLGLPAIIEAARGNAQEGLDRIREAMYALRRQETTLPVGVQAIQRLVSLFERATSIRVRCDFCNLPWTVSERVDSVLYHLVQEGLVNAFRHARASEVRIAFWLEGDEVRAQISDDGIGAERIAEGIGIRGMRERVEGLEGTLHVSSTPNGFVVRATIPAGKASGEGENTDPDR